MQTLKEKLKRKLKLLTANVLEKTNLTSTLSSHNPKTPLILMYHRVLDPKSTPYPVQAGMYVTPETFKMQMDFLSKHMNFISIDEAAANIKDGAKIPENSVCITFDDGWCDNYENAFPILKEHSIPAAIFLPTAFIETDKWFWSDSFSNNCFQIRKEKNQSKAIFELSEFSFLETNLNEEIQKLLHSGSDNSFSKHLDICLNLLKKIPLKKREELNSILENHTSSKNKKTKDRMFMNWQEIKEMSKSGIDFGSHSHNHLMFETLSEEEIKNELEISSTKLSMFLDKATSVFCYPEGSCNNSTHKTLSQINIPCTLLNKKSGNKTQDYASIGRIGIHEDITDTQELFNCRLKLQNIF